MVATGSALGAVTRFELGHRLLAARVPYPLVATLLVNLSGCLFAGLLAGYLSGPQTAATAFLATGFLGSYTTVSSFSLETLGAWQSGHRRLAASYVVTSLAGGLLLARAGWWLGAGIGS